MRLGTTFFIRSVSLNICETTGNLTTETVTTAMLSVCFCCNVLFSSQSSAFSLKHHHFSVRDLCQYILSAPSMLTFLTKKVYPSLDFSVIKQNSLSKESTKTTLSQTAGNVWKTMLHLDAVSFIYFCFASLFLFYTVDLKF